MTAINYRQGIAIGQLVFYTPVFFIAIFLCAKHSFGKKGGFYFLLIFSLARLIGAALEAATINDPTNVSLYLGALILQSIGVSFMLLLSLNLLGRVILGINSCGRQRAIVTTTMLTLGASVILVGTALGIAGGVTAGDSLSSTGVYNYGALSKVAVCIFLAGFVFLLLTTIVTCFTFSSAAPADRRLLTAIALSLPFLLVRQIYSALSTFGGTGSRFNLFSGDATILLVMEVIMEAIFVIIYSGVGLTLPKVEAVMPGEMANGFPASAGRYEKQGLQGNKQGSTAMRIAKRTIIGRLFMHFSGHDNRNKDMELQGRGY